MNFNICTAVEFKINTGDININSNIILNIKVY